MDVYSCFAVAWMVATAETAVLGKQLIEEACSAQNIKESQLTIHSDRGAPMKSKTVAQLLSDLDIQKSFSRPSVSKDNARSEALFKTFKYCPPFPKEFGSIEDARIFCRAFFQHYNEQHYHSGINYLTPQSLHHNQANEVIEQRNVVLEKAFHANPNRFVKGVSYAGSVPKAAWINPPKLEKQNTSS